MATYHKQLIAALAVGAVAVGSLAYVGRTPSGNSGETDTVRVIDDPKPPSQWAINAAYGRGALSNLRAAYIELENRDVEQARMGVVVARSLLAKIDSAKRKPDDGSNGDEGMVLVHAEVHVMDDVESENVLESKLDEIRRSIDMSDADAVVSALRGLEIPLTYTRVNLPLEETISEIDYVLEALNANDTERASAMLANIGNGLRIDTMQIDAHQAPPGDFDDDDAG